MRRYNHFADTTSILLRGQSQCKKVLAGIFSLLFIYVTPGISQVNLIKNGGFEQHGRIECMYCYHLYGKYSSVVYDWDNMGWACPLFDKDYQLNSDEKKWNPMVSPVEAHQGKAMIKLEYSPICGGRGCMSYINARTTETIEVGQLYEISIWMYIEQKEGADPQWAENIGIALLPEKPAYQYGFQVPAMRIDTVVYNNWHEFKWYVRPLCAAKYLMIGVYRTDEWPKSKSFRDVQYFIDDVSVTKLQETNAAVIEDSTMYYCSRYGQAPRPDLQPGMDKITLLFETNASDIIPVQAAILDSFALYAKKHPKLVFEIAGHTDSIGTNNLVLSQKRAQSVLQYLMTIHQLTDTRFFITTASSAIPIGTNNNEQGRALNRRVEIRQLNMELGNMFYRKALQKMSAEHPAEVFAHLNKWLRATGPSQRLQLLFDPRFAPLHQDKRWALIEKTIRDGYSKKKYPNFAFLIDSLRMNDQRVSGELAWDFCEMNPDSVPFRLSELSISDIGETLRGNFAAFKTVLQKIGWPKMSDFGEETAFSAFILLQHAQDSSEWVRWLPVIKKYCDEGEASWMAYAMLYDRCQLTAGKPQRYATHSEVLEDGSIRVLPYVGDKKSINAERAKIGLPLLPPLVEKAMDKRK